MSSMLSLTEGKDIYKQLFIKQKELSRVSSFALDRQAVPFNIMDPFYRHPHDVYIPRGNNLEAERQIRSNRGIPGIIGSELWKQPRIYDGTTMDW